MTEAYGLGRVLNLHYKTSSWSCSEAAGVDFANILLQLLRVQIPKVQKRLTA